MNQMNDYFDFELNNQAHPNPLDYLLDDFPLLKRKPRSSMESSDRQGIPQCEPPYISIRRDSNRSRISYERMSP